MQKKLKKGIECLQPATKHFALFFFLTNKLLHNERKRRTKMLVFLMDGQLKRQQEIFLATLRKIKNKNYGKKSKYLNADSIIICIRLIYFLVSFILHRRSISGIHFQY